LHHIHSWPNLKDKKNGLTFVVFSIVDPMSIYVLRRVHGHLGPKAPFRTKYGIIPPLQKRYY
jgi:hypothetical protein